MFARCNGLEGQRFAKGQNPIENRPNLRAVAWICVWTNPTVGVPLWHYPRTAGRPRQMNHKKL